MKYDFVDVCVYNLKTKILPNISSYDVAVIQRIASCQKNHMTARVKTLWRLHVTSLTTSMSTMRFLMK